MNLRSLPLSVKRRIPPRPRFRMPPSFRGVSSLAFGAKHVVVWLVTVFLYGLPSGVVPDFSPYIPGWLPHEGRDPPPSLSGGFQPCGILHTVGAAAAPPPPPPCEGERMEIKWERRAFTPTLPFSHVFAFLSPISRDLQNLFRFLRTYLLNLSTVSNLTPHTRHFLLRNILPSGCSRVSYTKLSEPQRGHILAAKSVFNSFRAITPLCLFWPSPPA